jgi:microcystin-dependent protein
VATVTGVTAARASEIEDKIIVDAERQGTSLVFTTDGGTVISVDNAFPDLYENYPVGSIYMTDRSANPSTYMGGGTWVRWGKGRVPVSVDEAQTEFDTVEETGGAKTHTLTTNEMPSHNHGGATGNNVVGADYDSVPTNYYDTTVWGLKNEAGVGYDGRVMVSNFTSESHNHSITPQGGGAAHNNLQPYITVYMWKRTA